MRIKIGELLVRARVISEQQLTSALGEQRKSGNRLGDTLVKMGAISEDLLVKALSKQLGIPRADLSAPVTGAAVRRMDRNLARSHDAVPLALTEDGRTLTVAMVDPSDLEVIEKMRAATGCRIVAYLAGGVAIAAQIERLYPADGSDEPETQTIDARTLMKSMPPAPKRPSAAPRTTFGAAMDRPVTGPVASRPPPPAPTVGLVTNPLGSVGTSPEHLLKSMEEVQHREITALRAMVELLIDKGVFSREEYLARMKR